MRLGPWPVRSLRLRAFAVILVVTVAPLAFVAAASAIEHGVGDRMRDEVSAAAARLARGAPAGLPELERRAAVLAEEGVTRIRAVDREGATLFDHDHDAGSATISVLSAFFFGPDGAPTLADYDRQLPPLGVRPDVVSAAGGKPAADCARTSEGRLLICSAAHAVALDDGRTAVVYVQESSRRAIRALYDLRYQLLKLTLLVLPGALLLAWWLGWRMVRPIEKLQAQVSQQLATQAPGPGFTVTRQDEFGELASAFNQLLARLDERARKNEAFVADLAHELKNPVAAIRAAAESLEKGAVDETRAARLGRVLAGSSRRLDVVVSQLLELARAEAGLHDEERSHVDLAALIEGVVEGYRSDDRYAEHRFVVDVEHLPPVQGVTGRLETAVRNLVENAASFAAESGKTVTLTGRGEGGQAVLFVDDDGPGLAEADLPRVFDRFFTTRSQREGTGLGLALVRAVVEAHGGQVYAENRAEGGARFVLSLPIASTTAQAGPSSAGSPSTTSPASSAEGPA